MEITFPGWFILVGIAIYVASVYAFVEYRKKRQAARFKQRQKEVRHFNWLTQIGMKETRRYFNTIGQNKLWYPWWDK